MDKEFKFTNSVVGLPLFFVVLLWFVFWLEVRFDFDFVQNGIYPRTLSGLQGVIFSPFIHADSEHLYNNSLPLLVLVAALQFFYPKQSVQVIIFGILLSGIFTWSIGRENYHIGASGLIYVLFIFFFIKGKQTKQSRHVALSLAVIVVYGGLVWYIFPTVDVPGEKSISWEGHLSGLLAGIILSTICKTPEYKKAPKYDWEKPDYNPENDTFMQRFDENGNFVNLPIIEEEPIFSYYSSNIPVAYEITSNEKNESKLES